MRHKQCGVESACGVKSHVSVSVYIYTGVCAVHEFLHVYTYIRVGLHEPTMPLYSTFFSVISSLAPPSTSAV